MPKARDRRPQRVVWVPKIKALKIKLAETGVSQVQLATDIGRNRQHISDVINGHRTSEVMARQIADYFEVPIEELFEATDLWSVGKTAAA